MTDNDTPGPLHAENMLGIDPPERNLRIMRVHTPQDQPVPQLLQDLSHPRTEEPRPRPEVIRRHIHTLRRIDVVDLLLHGPDLLDEHAVAQRPRRLVVHGVVAELVAAVHQIAQRLLAPGHLRADDKKGRRGAVRLEDLQDLIRVLGWRVVDGQGHDLFGGRHLP